MAEKYSWFNEEWRPLIVREVEEMLLLHPSSSHLVAECRKCGHLSPVPNQTPFGVEKVADWLINEMRAVEFKQNQAALIDLLVCLGAKHLGPNHYGLPSPSRVGEEG